MNNSLIKLEKAEQLLAEARTLDDLRQIRDLAVAAQSYAKAAHLGMDSQNRAAEVRFLAERRAGQLLSEMKRKGERHAGKGREKERSKNLTVKLADLGVQKHESARWQALADLPETAFRNAVTEGMQERLTDASLQKAVKQHRSERTRAARQNAYAVESAAPPTLHDVTLHAGDALEILRGMPSESVHQVITSPPYPGVPNLWGPLFAPENFDNAHAWLDSIWEECARVLMPGCKLCINIANIGRRPYLYNSARVAMWGMRSHTVEPIGEIIWHKFVGTRPGGSDTAFGTWCNPSDMALVDSHEYILIFRKRGTRTAPTKEPVIAKEQFLEWRKTFWQAQAAHASRVGHCAPFPPDLPHRLITLYSFAGETVLDPFLGSGTTLVEALKLKRKGIGIEIDAENVQLAKRNLDRAAAGSEDDDRK